jgi:transcriptional regulator with PAS, ATPase and Fis domain
MYEDHVETAKQIFEQNGYAITVVYTEIHRIAENVKLLVEQGAKVLIARGGVPSLIKQHHSLPIVELRYGFLDFLDPIEKAYAISDKVALLGWYRSIRNFARYSSLLRDNLLYVEFEETTPVDCEPYIEREVRAAAEKGIGVVVGGGGVVRAARRLGLPCVHVDIDRKAFLDAAEEAFYHLQIYEEKERRYETITAILNSVAEGVLALNEQGLIVHSNPLARRIMGIPDENPPLPVEKYLPDGKTLSIIAEGKPISNRFISIGNNRVVLNSDVIRINNRPAGTVIVLQETDSIRNLEKKIRINMVESGHFAKHRFSDIIGVGHFLVSAKKKAGLYAGTDSNVLITGETGTGKEIFAQSIHNESPRRGNPFVAINCAAIPESLLESELFGYVKGSFTGARSEGKVGFFELAHKGTIFLDEIGEISPKVQARLLRVLQEKEIIRVGGDRVVPIDVRIIAATNKNLSSEIAAGCFREDLYYRLCVLSIDLPPLRERKEDIIPTLMEFIARSGFGRRTFTEKAQSILCAQEWRGNVRELNNFAERLCVTCASESIDEREVSEALGIRADTETLYRVLPYGNIHRVDGDYILETLKSNYGNRKETARQLGISSSTLWRRLREIAAPSEADDGDRASLEQKAIIRRRPRAAG